MNGPCSSPTHWQRALWGSLFGLLLPAVLYAAPVVFFSDLESGPTSGGLDDNGAFVSVWGKGFGPVVGTVTVGGGQVESYLEWADGKIVFQLGGKVATGNIVVTTVAGASSNGIPFSVRPGRIFFVAPNGTGSGTIATPMSPAAAYRSMEAGDTFYFRGGTYAGQYGSQTWGSYNYTLSSSKGGAPGSPLALVGYPGETAVFQAPSKSYGNITMTDGSSVADHVTISNLSFKGASSCINGGGFWRNAHSGASNVRIVGNTISGSYTGNTMTGLIVLQNDHWRVWGNEIRDTGTTPPINNNHAIYVQTGASDVDIGWNRLYNLRMGHVIQVHTDIQYLYEDLRIHDNVITATNIDDSRGINIGNTLPGSYGVIYNNILYNLGQRFSAIAIYSGNWKIFNNTLFNIHAPAPAMLWVSGQFGGSPSVEVFNNIFYSDGKSRYVGAENGATMAQVSLSNNLYFNAGAGPGQDRAAVNADPLFENALAGNFRLRPGSPGIDAGLMSSISARDHDGKVRPQGRGIDIGAYESR